MGVGLVTGFSLYGIAGAPTQSKQPEGGSRISVGTASGTPASAVIVPIYFEPAEGVEVGQLKLQVTYVSANLQYVRSDPGLAIDSEEFEVRAEARDGHNDRGVKEQTVALTVSFRAPESQTKGIPPGLLGYLVLNIGEQAQPAIISMRVSAAAEELGSRTPIADLKALNGEVKVDAPGEDPAVACFFFTH